MSKIFRKLLLCMCIMLIIINFTIGGLSFAEEEVKSAKELSSLFEESYEDDDSTVGEQITKVLSGIVGILTWQPRILAIAASTIVQTLGAAVANMAGNVDTVDKEKVIALTPDDIIFNKILLTDINFFNTNLPNGNVIKLIREQIALWYYIIRTIAIVISLIILVFVGIRMAITTVASDKAIYKKALFDWVTSLALIFLLHYIIRGVIWLNEILVEVLFEVNKSGQMKEILDAFKLLLFHPDFCIGFGSVILYVIITVQSLMFLITYIKRMLTLAFLIIISPLITITYSIDKMGDQKAQALNTWLKEFSYNVLIQPFHCILYLVFVSTAIKAVAGAAGSLASVILAVLCIKFVWDGEKIVRKIFGFEQASSLGAVAASGAMIGAALQKARSAGSTVSSGVKFAKNTKTGQAIKSKIDTKKTERRQNKAARQITGDKNATFADLSDKDKEKAKKQAESMKERKTPIRKMKEKREFNRLKQKADENGIKISDEKLREKAAKNVAKKAENAKKDHPLRAALLEDGKKFTRSLLAPEKIAKVGAAVMAGAAMYALPDSNLFAAVGGGYAAGKSAETGIRNLKERKKENFEENVLKAWERHCSINNIPENKRTQQSFENWYNNTYSKGKYRDEYSTKKMGKEQKSVSEDLRDKVGLVDADISDIIAKIQKAIIGKENYDPDKMFKEYKDKNDNEVSAAAIAAVVSAYATKFNESWMYQDASNYNTQMSQFGITHEDAVAGIAINETAASNTQEYLQEEISTEVESLVNTSSSSDTSTDIADRLEAQYIADMGRIEASMMQAKTDLAAQAVGIDTDKIVSQLQTTLDKAVTDISADASSEIESAVRSLGLTGAVADLARNYGTGYIEMKKVEEKATYVEVNKKTIIKDIEQRRNP